MLKKKRVKEFERVGPSKSTFFNSFIVEGYYIKAPNGKIYLTYAKKMADACSNVDKITKENDIYKNEKLYVIPADLRDHEVKPFWWPGRQLAKPVWWYGRVYEVDVDPECINPTLNIFGERM